MSRQISDSPPGHAQPSERRGQSRGADTRWRTSLTLIEPNTILVRGYALDELPVWLFDVDDDGALDVISTLCEGNARTLDGRLLAHGQNPCCGC